MWICKKLKTSRSKGTNLDSAWHFQRSGPRLTIKEWPSGVSWVPSNRWCQRSWLCLANERRTVHGSERLDAGRAYKFFPTVKRVCCEPSTWLPAPVFTDVASFTPFSEEDIRAQQQSHRTFSDISFPRFEVSWWFYPGVIHPFKGTWTRDVKLWSLSL